MDHRKDRIGKLRLTKLPHEFYELYAFPFNWQAKAMELHRSALILGQQFLHDSQHLSALIKEIEAGRLEKLPETPPSVMNQFVLLAAFSLENLFKGLVLFKEPHLIRRGKLTGILKSHDLLSLAARADVSLAPEEHRFCVIASNAAVYWGRYPVSDSADTVVSSSMVCARSFPVFDNLFQRASALYKDRFHARTRPSSAGA